jgi:hypothetical protein
MGHSHLAYTELLADEKDATYNCFLIRAVGWLERHGVTINLVITDNGSGYRPYLSLTFCHSLAVKPYTRAPTAWRDDSSRPAS